MRSAAANESSSASEPLPSLGEEVAGSVSHGMGLAAAFVAGPTLIARVAAHRYPWGTISASVCVATLISMYLASTLYHALPPGRAKPIFRKLEHGAIFLLIAGTYTSFTLVALGGAWGWTVLGVVWVLAAVGIALKAILTTRHRWLPGLAWRSLPRSGFHIAILCGTCWCWRDPKYQRALSKRH